jgi:hypothetical protein
MKDSDGHVVPLVIPVCEFLNRRENVAKIEGRVFGMPTANVLNASEAKLLIACISGFRQTIRAGEHGIARPKLQGEFVAADAGEKARRDPSELQGAAIPAS